MTRKELESNLGKSVKIRSSDGMEITTGVLEKVGDDFFIQSCYVNVKITPEMLVAVN